MICLEQSPNAVEGITDKAKNDCHKDYMGEIHAYGVSAKESYGAVPTSVQFGEQTSAF